jgi:hypothetical protein
MTTLIRSISLAAAAALALPLAAQTQPQAPMDPSPAEAAFKRVDANADGKISRQEATAMPGLAAKFVELDRDKDGALTLAEFSTAYSAAPSSKQ